MLDPALVEVLRWIGLLVLAPLFGWFGWKLAARRSAKERRRRLFVYFNGLPDKAKAALIEFYEHRAHTLRGDPEDPAIRLLVRAGIVVIGPGGGTYDAVDRYLIIPIDIWEVVNEWAGLYVILGENPPVP